MWTVAQGAISVIAQWPGQGFVKLLQIFQLNILVSQSDIVCAWLALFHY